MKYAIPIPMIILAQILLPSCQQQTPKEGQQQTIDSLKEIVQLLKPGLGEFMVQLEFHEGRLAKSIAEKDYERAAFETDEMTEVAEKVDQLHISNEKLKEPFGVFYKKYLTEPLDSLKAAAEKKDGNALRANLDILVNNCNSCHRENNMPFMKIYY